MYCWSAFIWGRKVGGTRGLSLNLVSDVGPVDFSIIACSFHSFNFKRCTRVVYREMLRFAWPRSRAIRRGEGGWEGLGGPGFASPPKGCQGFWRGYKPA